MEVLVTGGNGNVGRHLVPALQGRGHSVRVLALPAEDTSWLEKHDVAVYRGDVRQPETLTAPMRGVQGVLHLAGLMGVWRPMEHYRAVNVTGTENVCRAALAEGIRRLVHVSSWTVYGRAVRKPTGEDCPLAPQREPYSITKAEADRLVQRMIVEDRLPAVIIRPGTIFGPGDHLNFGRTADRLRAGKSVIVGSGHNALPCVYVTDVVQGLLLALDHERAVGQAYNITNDRPLTQQEFLQAIAKEIGAKPPRLHVPYHALYAAAYAAERVAMVTHSQRDPLVTRHGVMLFGADNRHSIDKARRELGYSPRVELREGVRLAAAWFRQWELSAPGTVPPVPQRPWTKRGRHW
jgi:nucleoside-diphosphate-sugar epimerase